MLGLSRRLACGRTDRRANAPAHNRTGGCSNPRTDSTTHYRAGNCAHSARGSAANHRTGCRAHRRTSPSSNDRTNASTGCSGIRPGLGRCVIGLLLGLSRRLACGRTDRRANAPAHNRTGGCSNPRTDSTTHYRAGNCAHSARGSAANHRTGCRAHRRTSPSSNDRTNASTGCSGIRPGLGRCVIGLLLGLSRRLACGRTDRRANAPAHNRTGGCSNPRTDSTTHYRAGNCAHSARGSAANHRTGCRAHRRTSPSSNDRTNASLDGMGRAQHEAAVDAVGDIARRQRQDRDWEKDG